MANIVPVSSALRELLCPKLEAKAPKKLVFLFLKIPPQEEMPGLPIEAPSMLHLIQLKIGGCHTTSIILGALGGMRKTLNALRIVKSIIEEVAWKLL